MENQNSRDISGTKLLVLHKQHYLEMYSEPLESEYSCMGYFDGMDIVEVEKVETQLFELKCNSGISDMWYQSIKEVQKMKGYVGSQTIGMFRCACENDEREREKNFWSNEKRRIFMAVCFLQISEDTDLENFRKELEEQSTSEISMLGYFTFDNADLILFIQSNSFSAMIKKIEEIDKMHEVRYVHPVKGVYEQSLKKFISQGDLSFYDMEGNPLINDDIKELRIEIVGDAGEFEDYLRYIFEDVNNKYTLKNYNAARWSYMTEHENYVLLFENTDIRTALILMIPEGAVTHQNVLFGRVIYNMETQIRLQEQEFKSLGCSKPKQNELEKEEQGKKRSEKNKGRWCRNQIEQYRGYMQKALMNEDQGICSYCQAMIQTLNTLAQFENFKLSRNIFYIIYPAFKLFSEQLKCISEDFENISHNPHKMKIQEAMRDFLDSVNSIVYHAIHMDQIYLMIPGCSGTSFSIPTKLSLFYLWFLNGISKILNDTSNKYEFYLTPVMESKPCTYPIEFGLPRDGDRLVCVKVSQRSLYVPGQLLIILAHEMAHYVGKEIRSREIRWEKVKETMAVLIAEAIIPHWYLKEGKNLHVKYKEIYKYVCGRLQNSLIHAKYEENIRYHVSAVAKILKDECARILADENSELKEIIKSRIDENELANISFEKMVEKVEESDRLSEKFDKRRIAFLGNGDCDRIIDMLLREYQEIFADTAALVILQFEKNDYSYAYNISEGYGIDETYMPNKDYNRKKILFENTLVEKTSNTSSNMQEDSSESDFKDKHMIEYWSNLDFVQNKMREYVDECKTRLEKRIDAPDIRDYVDAVRDAYSKFSTSRFSCREIYSMINDNARAYAKEIQAQLEKYNTSK